MAEPDSPYPALSVWPVLMPSAPGMRCSNGLRLGWVIVRLLPISLPKVKSRSP